VHALALVRDLNLTLFLFFLIGFFLVVFLIAIGILGKKNLLLVVTVVEHLILLLIIMINLGSCVFHELVIIVDAGYRCCVGG